jgi:hypothetical protein
MYELSREELIAYPRSVQKVSHTHSDRLAQPEQDATKKSQGH